MLLSLLRFNFFLSLYLLISTLLTEIFNSGAISLERRFNLKKTHNLKSLWVNEGCDSFTFFKKSLSALLKAFSKNSQSSFPFMFLLIILVNISIFGWGSSTFNSFFILFRNSFRLTVLMVAIAISLFLFYMSFCNCSFLIFISFLWLARSLI